MLATAGRRAVLLLALCATATHAKSDRWFNAWSRSPRAWAHIKDVFDKGKVVHIDEALRPAKARALFKEFEDPSFTYDYMAATYPLYQFSGTTNMGDRGRTPAWGRLHRYLESKAVLANMSAAAGVRLVGMSDKVSVNPPGNYTGPHTDVSARGGERRRIAWVLHMCKDWDDNLGGDLIMLTIPNAPSGYHVIPCRFNSLTLFPVHRFHSTHMVLPVHIGGPGESWNPSRDRRVRGKGNTRLPAGVSPRRLAHQGWFQVRDTPRTRAMDEGALPAGSDNAAGDDWLGLYINGRTPKKKKGGTGDVAMRHCIASLAVYCMYGENARRGWDATGLDAPGTASAKGGATYRTVVGGVDDGGGDEDGDDDDGGGGKDAAVCEEGDCDADFI